MKSKFALLIGIVVAVVILAWMFTFQVRYDQVAVVTTFKRATAPAYRPDGSIDPEKPGSVVVQPGFYFRLPPPVQEVHSYSTRLQILENPAEELQTADGYSVILRTYLTWRIKDPLAFFVKFQTDDKAREQLAPIMRDLLKVVGRYRFDELVNTDPGKLKLRQLEEEALAQLRKQLAAQGYGIEAEQVGVRRLMLPEKVTEKVFERMRATRETLAANAKKSGEADAATIRSEADAAAQRIKAFAERRAQAIRTQGDREAAEYYEVFNQDKQLATFLRQLDTLRKVLPHHTTFLLDANQLNLRELMGTTAPEKKN